MAIACGMRQMDPRDKPEDDDFSNLNYLISALS